MEENGSNDEEREYEESEDGTVTGLGEGNPPSYQDIIKEEDSSTDEDEN